MAAGNGVKRTSQWAAPVEKYPVAALQVELSSGCSPSGCTPVLLTSHQLRNRGETFYFSSWGADPTRDKAVTTPEQRGGLLNIQCSL